VQECRRSSRSGQVLDPHASSFLIGKHNRSMQSKGLACSLANRRIVSRPVGHGGIHSSKQRLRECGDPDSLSLVYCSLRSARSRLIVLNRIGQVAEFIQPRLDVLCEAPCPGTAASSEWQYDVWTGVTRPEVGLRATKAAARISRMSSSNISQSQSAGVCLRRGLCCTGSRALEIAQADGEIVGVWESTPRGEAFSFKISTDDQAESDAIGMRSSPMAGACGWCEDHWGLSRWIPSKVGRALTRPQGARPATLR